MKLKKICIISHQHLSRNPRVLKEAVALDKLAYEVTVLTSIYDNKLYIEDLDLISKTNISLVFYNNLTKKNFLSYKNRICSKIGRFFNKMGVENIFALGYAPKKCLTIAIAQNAHLYICHQDLPTYIGTILITKNKRVAFDFEDFYSEDLLVKDKKYRPQKLLEKAERFALNNAAILYTTSSPLASGLKNKYQSQNDFKIIFNSFKSFRKKTKVDATTIKLIWLSQTIGPGRGLELIITALNQVNNNNFTLYLRGYVSNDYKTNLTESLTNKLHKIIFLPLLPNKEISVELCKYHIGIASELDLPISRYLTLTNKIFHYLSVGLPVIASATAGQLSLAKNFIDGIKYFRNMEELIIILNHIQSDSLNKLNEQILAEYETNFDWEIQEKKIQQSVLNIL